MLKPRQSIVFPVPNDSSVLFSALGAYIDKATLASRGVPLSIIKPTYGGIDIDAAPAPPSDLVTDLPFFGDKPFHAALAAGWQPQVTLTFIPNERMPSLRFATVPGPTWETLGRPEYIETVTAGSNSGPVTLDLVYQPAMGGYRPAST